jgi:hypothetical protein
MIPQAAIALRDAINEVRALSIAEMQSRGKVATGRTISTLSTVVSVTPGFVTGELQGESQWRWVGNGRAPGRMPPVAPIQAWVDAKGLSISAWAVAKAIGKRGSKDFRDKKTNVFMDAMDQWEKGGGPEKTGNEAGQYFEEQAINVAINNLKR